MGSKNIIADKSYNFALRIIRLYTHLKEKQKEFILSKQLLRSGTSIGALVSEAKFAQSTADFIHKNSIALKEANETLYWINLLKDSGFIDEKMYTSIAADVNELISLLVSIVKTSKKRVRN